MTRADRAGPIRFRRVAAVAMLGAAILFSGGARAESSAGRLQFEECRFDGIRAQVECGTLEVFENRKAAAGRKIRIYFVRARATGPNPAPDPVFELSGGPGAQATFNVAAKLRSSSRQLERRDIVIFDQRGTGRSGRLDCTYADLKADPSAFERLFDQDFFDPQAYRDCLQKLKGKADLTQYATSIVADDINDLRQALGYQKINLEGGSYGTRLGLEYIRRHPETVRSAVLRGVAPSFALLVETVAKDFQDALQALIADCQASARCSGAFPDFEGQLKQMLQRVKREPVQVQLRNPSSGKREEVVLRHPQLVTALRYALYSTRQSASLPFKVQAAAQGDYGPVAEILAELLHLLTNAMAEGMWASVICSEEVAYVDVEKARRLSQGTVLGTLRLDAELAICESWPRATIPSNFHQPVVSDVPVLLVAGDFDPASPLSLAKEALKTLKNGTLVRVANRSHWGLGGDCVEGIVSQFLEKGSSQGIDLSCAAEFKRPPFEI